MKVDKPIVIISRFNIKRRDLSDEVVAYDATWQPREKPSLVELLYGTDIRNDGNEPSLRLPVCSLSDLAQ